LSRRHIYRIITRHPQQEGVLNADRHDSNLTNSSP
jgi:hypothetical protein